MFAQQHPKPCAKRARQRKRHQAHQRQKNQRQLQRAAPLAAEIAHVIADAGDEQQVGTGQQQRRRMEHQLARQLDLADPVAVPGGREQQQRHQGRVDNAANAQCVRIHAIEQHRLRKQVEVVEEHARQPEADRLGVPQRVFGQVAKQLLHQHQPQQRQRHHGEKQQRRALAIGPRPDHGKQQGDSRQQRQRHRQRCQPAAHIHGLARRGSPKQADKKRKPGTVATDVGQRGGGPPHRRAHGHQTQRAPGQCQRSSKKNRHTGMVHRPAEIPLSQQPQHQHRVGHHHQGTAPDHQRMFKRGHGCSGTYCAPLPVSTTPTVSNRITRSRNSEWFFT